MLGFKNKLSPSALSHVIRLYALAWVDNVYVRGHFVGIYGEKAHSGVLNNRFSWI